MDSIWGQTKLTARKVETGRSPSPGTLCNDPFGCEALSDLSPGEYTDMVCNLPLQSDSHLWEMKREKPLNILIWKLPGQGRWHPH